MRPDSPPGAAQAPGPAELDGWRREAPMGVIIRLVSSGVNLIPVAILAVSAISGSWLGAITAAVVLPLLALLAAGPAVIGWATTEYRVGADLVEQRSGLLSRKHRTARRERIRSVDIDAGALHRIFGLAKVGIGTSGDATTDAIVLAAIDAARATRLREELLARAAPVIGGQRGISGEAGASAEPWGSGEVRPDGVVLGAAAAGLDAAPAQQLAAFELGWLRYAPFGLTGLVALAGAVGVGWRLVDELNLTDRAEGAASSLRAAVGAIPVPALIVGGPILLIGFGAAVSVLAYLVSYYGFRLTRRGDGSLHTTRGLLATAATSLDAERLRGVTVIRPLFLRWARGAKVRARVTGAQRSPLLLPPVSVDLARRVAAEVLCSAPGGTPSAAQAAIGTDLVDHGPAARRRRYTRALVVPAVALLLPIAWLLFVGVAQAAVGFATVAVAGAGMAAIARERAQNLGHRQLDELLVVQGPTLARNREIQVTEGVVAVAYRSTLWQRRSEITTVLVGTAAGDLPIVDVPERAAVALGGEFVPSPGCGNTCSIRADEGPIGE